MKTTTAAMTHMQINRQGVYLFHLGRPFKHAQHYIGWSQYIPRRIWHQRQGSGSRFCAAAVGLGIKLKLVRVWTAEGENTRTFERRLKNQKNARRLCPICRKEDRKRRWSLNRERRHS